MKRPILTARNETSTSIELSILVVDDERNILDYMRTLLEAEGHKVLCLDSVDDAIQHVRYVRFDVAFIGAVMPDGDGIEVGPLVKTLSPRTSVYLFMEPVAEDWAASLRRDGFNVEALRCPCEAADLLEIVASVKSKKARIGRNHSLK